MNLIESGMQLASINLAWNLSSAILGSFEHQLCYIIFRVTGRFVIGFDHYGMKWLLTNIRNIMATTDETVSTIAKKKV